MILLVLKNVIFVNGETSFLKKAKLAKNVPLINVKLVILPILVKIVGLDIVFGLTVKVSLVKKITNVLNALLIAKNVKMI